MSEADRDPLVQQRYRELPREEPPSGLDAAILAAARGEPELHPAPLVAPTARKRWYVPLAAAAVIMLSVIVTLQLQHEPPDAELAIPGYPSPGPGEQPESRAPAVSRPAPAAAGSPAPQPQAATTRADAKRGSAQRSESAAKPVQEDLPPEAWLARIAELRRAGRHAEADESYAAFRRRHPDYRIPEALREQVLPRRSAPAR